MRGYDYRCESGISLLIADALPQKRSFIQALGRVGRHTDKFSRYMLREIQPGYDHGTGMIGVATAGMKSVKKSTLDKRGEERQERREGS